MHVCTEKKSRGKFLGVEEKQGGELLDTSPFKLNIDKRKKSKATT